MVLSSPLSISARLLPAVVIAGATVSLDFTGGRSVKWFIDLPDGSEFSGSDFQAPACLRNESEESFVRRTFGAFLGFMAAAGESFNYAERKGNDGMTGENASLFPRPVTEFCAANSDELGTLSFDLENEENNESKENA